MDLAPGPERLDKGHQLALVVGCPARPDHLAVPRILDLRVEWRAVPQRQRIDRLHVVMAIEQQGPRTAGLRPGDHHGMPGRVADRCLKADPRQFVTQPFGRPAHIPCMGRIGRDRGDAQKGCQPVDGGIKPLVQPMQNGVQCGIL